MSRAAIRLLAKGQLFVMTAVILAPHLSNGGDDQHNIQLTVSAESETATTANPPIITLTFSNLSQSAVTVVEINDYRDYELSCINEDGSPVPLTEAGKQLREPASFGRRLSRLVEPGKKIETKLDLGKIFSFSKPGIYNVSAKRYYYTDEKHPQRLIVSSNTFSFKLTN